MDEQEMLALVKNQPQAEQLIRQFAMGDEFINNIKRYCLWLVDCPPSELRKMPQVLARVEKVREMRLASKNFRHSNWQTNQPVLGRQDNLKPIIWQSLEFHLKVACLFPSAFCLRTILLAIHYRR